MRKINIKSFFIIGVCFVIFGLNNYVFAAIETTEVDIISTSHPTAMTDTTISANFQYTDTSITGFYYTITTLSSHTITSDSILTNHYIDLPNDASATRGDGPYSDGNYYLYIAAYKDVFLQPTTLGPTTKVGPLIIDTQPPNYVTVNGPATTNENNVTLTLDSNEDINQICISETGFGNCGWVPLISNSYNYPLSEEKDYLLYIQVKDIAGNIAQPSSPFALTYITIEEKKYHGIPTITEWGKILFSGILLITGCYCLRRYTINIPKNSSDI